MGLNDRYTKHLVVSDSAQVNPSQMPENVILVNSAGQKISTKTDAELNSRYLPLVGTVGLYLDGTDNNKVSTPDAAALDVTDIEMWAFVAPDAWVSGQINVIAAKYNTSCSWQLYINQTGRLVFLWSANGTTVAVTGTSSVVIPDVADQVGKWVGVTLDADNGASGYTLKHYTHPGDRDTIPTVAGATQFGTTTTGGAATTVFAGTSSLEVGSINGSIIGGFKGVISRFSQRASIGGALVADCRLMQQAEQLFRITGQNFADSAGRVWTITGSTFEWRMYPRSTDLPIFGLSGDSLTVGAGANQQADAWYSQLGRAISAQHRIRMAAVSSRTCATAVTEDTTKLDPYLVGGGAGYAFGWMGTNDLFFGATAAATQASYQTWCEARQAAGWNVIAFTITPRSDASTPGSFEADRQTFNTWLRANYATFAAALVDVGGDTTIGEDDDELNATYYATDQVHMKAAGYLVVANLVKAALKTLGVE